MISWIYITLFKIPKVLYLCNSLLIYTTITHLVEVSDWDAVGLEPPTLRWLFTSFPLLSHSHPITPSGIEPAAFFCRMTALTTAHLLISAIQVCVSTHQFSLRRIILYFSIKSHLFTSILSSMSLYWTLLDLTSVCGQTDTQLTNQEHFTQLVVLCLWHRVLHLSWSCPHQHFRCDCQCMQMSVWDKWCLRLVLVSRSSFQHLGLILEAFLPLSYSSLDF